MIYNLFYKCDISFIILYIIIIYDYIYTFMHAYTFI